MDMQKTRKRRHYFIDRDFQALFITKFCVIVIISSLVIMAVLLVALQGSTTVAIENTHVVVKKTADFILPLLLPTVLIVVLFSAFAVLILTLFVSHKISGPLYRLTKEIDALTAGDLTRNFNIRGTDQLQNLSKSLLRMSMAIRGHYAAIKEKQVALRAYVEKKNSTSSDEDKREAQRLLSELESALDHFKVQ